MNSTEEITNKKFDFKLFFKKILMGLKYFKDNAISFPLYILAHPLKGFDEFKRDKKGKMWVALFLLFSLIILNIAKYALTGFVVSNVKVTSLNTFKEISTILLVVVVLTISNWSVTTLFDGKGKMKEIFMMICYCLYPLVWSKFFGLIVSNVVSENEKAIYSLVIGLGIFLMCYMGLLGLISIHEYGLLKCVLSILGTAIAAMIIFFIGILAFDLFQKLFGFAYTIYREISLRYFMVNTTGFIGGIL